MQKIQNKLKEENKIKYVNFNNYGEEYEENPHKILTYNKYPLNISCYYYEFLDIYKS